MLKLRVTPLTKKGTLQMGVLESSSELLRPKKKEKRREHYP